MNKQWSEMNKEMQRLLNSEANFASGIEALLDLRKEVMKQIIQFKDLSSEQLCAIPFINADGYHSKTILYSLYHIFRIEDLVCHTIILNDEEIYFVKDYQKKMNSPIITTGNELQKNDIAEFSKQLNKEAVFEYIYDVYLSSNEMLTKLTYKDLKHKYSEVEKQRIRDLQVVSTDLHAVWLIDYWCDKDLKGLLKMPFSRHWIMHVEAALRILDKITK